MAGKTVFILCLAAAVLAAGCCGATNSPPATPRLDNGRVLGIDLTLPADNDFVSAYDMAKDAGVGMVQVTPGWDDVEPSAGHYEDPQDNLASAKAFYSHENLSIALAVSPLDTNRDRRPPDLRDKPFDDPGTVGRYDAMLDAVLAKLDGVTLQDVAIGNEVDVYLGDDADKWEQYTDFYRQAEAHVKAGHPGLKVGVKATFDGLTKRNVDRLKKLNAESDVILVTYYPLNPDFTVKDPSVVGEDFNTICALYPGKEVYFLELGYPSSPLLNSSEEKQADFVRRAFAAWDGHAEQVRAVNFVYMHDVSPAQVDKMAGYYGLNDSKFKAYLGTLGLRTYDGKDKPAWAAFGEEARARGF